MKVPWTARRLNQSVLINPEYSLEGLELRLQYFGHLMGRTNSLEKTMMLVKIEGRRRRMWQRMRWLDSISDPMHMNLNNIWEIMKEEETGAVLQYMRSESRTVKKVENQRIDAFKLWCWRRLLRVHWTARRSNQSILKEINPEYSLEGLMLKLKLQ